MQLVTSLLSPEVCKARLYDLHHNHIGRSVVYCLGLGLHDRWIWVFSGICVGTAPQPGWRLFQPVMPPPTPCPLQHVSSAQANTQLWFFFCYVQVSTQARLPHINSFCFCCLLFTATQEGWSDVSSVDGEMRQSQMTGTFHRLWSSRIRSQPFCSDLPGPRKALLSSELVREREGDAVRWDRVHQGYREDRWDRW